MKCTMAKEVFDMLTKIDKRKEKEHGKKQPIPLIYKGVVAFVCDGCQISITSQNSFNVYKI